MNKHSILKYLSSTSDTFLILAFTSLLALPIAVSIAAQPVKVNQQNSEIALANAKSQLNKNMMAQNQPAAQITTQPTTYVLGVSDQVTQITMTPPVIMPLDARFAVIADKNKITFDGSTTNNIYVASGIVKIAGAYDLLTLHNNNGTGVKVNLNFDFTDSKATSFSIIINGKTYNLTRSNKEIPQITIDGNADSKISINSSKTGGFKLTIKMV